jgi:hypothetical protein
MRGWEGGKRAKEPKKTPKDDCIPDERRRPVGPERPPLTFPTYLWKKRIWRGIEEGSCT